MKVLICDRYDSAMDCKKVLESIAQKYSIDIDIAIVTSGKQLLFLVDSKHTHTDLIYLEYHLSDGDGMDVARELRKQEVLSDIVFYSRDEQCAIEGYDVDALHCILKDKDNEGKFARVFLKAVRRIQKRNEESISLFCAGETRKIEISTISYFEVNKRIITVHYGEKETFEFYSSLSRLEELLTGKGFVRIHQAFLVAEKFIYKKQQREIVMRDQTALPIGRSFRGKV